MDAYLASLAAPFARRSVDVTMS